MADTNLNVIALVSGGKDSLYSILHCISNGHRVIALANLYPRQSSTTTINNPHSHDQHGDNDDGQTGPQNDGEGDDIDSFMYQTIGHSVIPLYETALGGIPLYRAPIMGGAVDVSRVYGDSRFSASGAHSGPGALSAATDLGGTQGEDEDGDADETESLIPLLRKVTQAHPEADAVSAGAILSTYQRTRIENVAGRLGLIPLAWLWMYPVLPAPFPAVGGRNADAGLLEDMAAVGCSARIIKVASGGLDERFLWGDVSSSSSSSSSPGLRGRMMKTMRRFNSDEGDIRGAVLGEGGEYESLAVDGPGFLWRGRIVIEEREREVRSGEGGVGFVRLKGARCVPKETETEDGITPGDVRRPALLDGVFDEALGGLLSRPIETDTTNVRGHDKRVLPIGCPLTTQAQYGRIRVWSNITARRAGNDTGDQMRDIAEYITDALSHQLPATTSADAIFVTVLLRSMSDFASMNAAYVSLFQKPNPPARATVACGDTLPDAVNVMVSFAVDTGPRKDREGLHVQSRSYWAPASIGPYSQAISVPGSFLDREARLVFVAGQIPLEPAGMEIVGGSSSEGLLGRETWERAQQPEWLKGYMLRAVLALQHLWRIGGTMRVDWWVGGVAYLTGDDGNEVESKARVAWELWEKMHDKPSDDGDEDEDEEPALDAWDIRYGRRGHEQTTSSFGTSALPNFSILHEYNGSTTPPFFAAQVAELPRGSDIEWQGLGCGQSNQVTITSTSEETAAIGPSCTTTVDNKIKYIGIEIGIEQAQRGLKACLDRILDLEPSCCVTLYTTQPWILPYPYQVVPCLSVWGRDGRSLVAGVVVQVAAEA